MTKKLFLSLLVGLTCCSAFSQENTFVPRLQEKLASYYQLNFPLKINLFLNQPSYAPGDTVYFRVGLLSADNGRPLAGAAVLNVSLVNAENEVVHHQKIKIRDGKGYNQLTLSSTLKPGIYTLVTYNEWMKNHDHSLFAYYEIRVEAEKRLTRSSSKMDFNFFAEGGKLIQGITNKIIFTGTPFEKIRVTSNAGTSFPELILNENGFGVFFLTPLENAAYTASASAQQKKIKIEKDGVGMLTSMSQTDTTVRLMLQVSEHSSLRAQPINFVWTNGKHIYYAAALNFEKQLRGTIHIPQKSIPDGLSRITVFANSDSILAERLIYIPDERKKVELTTDHEQYGVREKVTVKLNTRIPGKSISWITVYNTDLFGTEEIEAHELQTLQALSRFPANGLDIPKKIMTTADVAQLNDFLITRQPKDFLWEEVLASTVKNEFPFRQDVFVTGKAYSPAGEKLPDSTYITFLQNDGMIHQISVDAEGHFDFSLLLDVYNKGEIYYKAGSRGRELEHVRVSISTDTLAGFYYNKVSWLNEENAYYQFSKNRNNLNVAFTGKINALVSPRTFDRNAALEQEASGADVVVLLKNYTQFPSMQEVLFEIVPFLSYQKKDGRSAVRLLLDKNILPKHNPMYMIDGVITEDTDYFMSLQPENVISIKLIRNIDKLNRFGDFGKNGIVLVETKIRDNYLNVPASDRMFLLEGLTKGKPFNPVPQDWKERTPVIQSTLYFNPYLETDETGNAIFSFYSADNTGKFRIHVQGINAEGGPFTITRDFEVRYKQN